MDFKTSQKIFSAAKMGKYANACSGDKRKTMLLYRYNLRLCQRFCGVLNLFEVMLRNDRGSCLFDLPRRMAKRNKEEDTQSGFDHRH